MLGLAPPGSIIVVPDDSPSVGHHDTVATSVWRAAPAPHAIATTSVGPAGTGAPTATAPMVVPAPPHAISPLTAGDAAAARPSASASSDVLEDFRASFHFCNGSSVPVSDS